MMTTEGHYSYLNMYFICIILFDTIVFLLFGLYEFSSTKVYSENNNNNSKRKIPKMLEVEKDGDSARMMFCNLKLMISNKLC